MFLFLKVIENTATTVINNHNKSRLLHNNTQTTCHQNTSQTLGQLSLKNVRRRITISTNILCNKHSTNKVSFFKYKLYHCILLHAYHKPHSHVL